MKNKILVILICSFVSISFVAFWVGFEGSRVQKGGAEKQFSRHSDDIKQIDDQWKILREAYKLEEAKNYDGAVALFQKAIKMGDQNVPRNALRRIYEKMGAYDLALEQIEWFLSGSQNEQGRAETLEMKNRILESIKKQQETSAQPKAADAA